MKVTICEFCDGKFATPSNLADHQKYAKYCISKRLDSIPEYICEYCDKTFVTKYTLNTHSGTCSIKKEQEYKAKIRKIKSECKSQLSEKNSQLSNKEKENKALKSKIKELEAKLQEKEGIIVGIKTAPTKTMNTMNIHPKLVNLPIGNIRALTNEFIEERVNDGILTYEKAARGYKGMLEVICELITHENDDGIIERNYVCTDVSRNSFHRLIESKKWKSDKGGRYLNSMLDTFKESMEEHKDKVYKTYKQTPHDSLEWDQVNWERKNISRLYGGVVCKEGTDDRVELVNILRREIGKRASV
uniref:Fez1 n=1 Tax=Marseillevirus LCMAC101 TaxID=2506602 RepID=A0A481YQF2_9VIRU|nr:MAG: Fez1 [Marseillevirus LCMAC101]